MRRRTGLGRPVRLESMGGVVGRDPLDDFLQNLALATAFAAAAIPGRRGPPAGLLQRAVQKTDDY